jgi:hypothetical protein
MMMDIEKECVRERQSYDGTSSMDVLANKAFIA